MAFDNLVQTNSFNSTNTLANQFVFVTVDPANSNSVILPTAGGYAIGVTQDTPSAGDPTAVCTIGSVTKVLCSASISVGQDVSTDANGNAIPAVSADYVLGTCIEAGTNGFLAVIIYQPRGAKGIV
jgi:Uncharacterized conserved protein (DUF2190)